MLSSSFAVVCAVCSVSVTVAMLPIIDIMPLRDLTGGPGSPFLAQVTNVTNAIEQAMKTFGCFIATGHDMEFLWEDLLQVSSKELFALPLKELEDVAISKTNVFGRGYLEKGKESGVKSTYFEHKEGYSYGYPHQTLAKNIMEQTNLWPAGLSQSSIALLDSAFIECIRVAKLILGALSDSAVVAQADGGDTISLMRAFHYFSSHDAPLDIPAGKTLLGSSPHTDWGFLTVILQDDTGGLQFYHEGTWVDVPVVRFGLVINGGDYLRMLSGGKCVSPIHRVLLPTEPDVERFSFVFFYYPPYGAPIPQRNNDEASVTDTVATELEFNTFSAVTVETDGESSGTSGADGGSGNSTNSSENPDTLHKTFGHYIMAKWDGVQA